MDPVVSVVLPTFNRMQWLPAAVSSIQSQTLSDWELIVVDDGSTDGTGEWIRGLSEPRLRYVFRAHRGSIAAARNIGLAEARGPWVAFLDSDDRWRPHKLALQRERLENDTKSPWCYGAYELINPAGAVVPRPSGGPWRPFDGWIAERLLTTEASVAVQTLLVRADVARALRFDERIPVAEDYDFALRLAFHSPALVVAEPIAEIRIHEARTTSLVGPYLGNLGMAMVYRKAARMLQDQDLRRLARRQERSHFAALAKRAIRQGAVGELARATRSLWAI
jgi:glycosyltransferase involved in cell wall biosynthesis